MRFFLTTNSLNSNFVASNKRSDIESGHRIESNKVFAYILMSSSSSFFLKIQESCRRIIFWKIQRIFLKIQESFRRINVLSIFRALQQPSTQTMLKLRAKLYAAGRGGALLSLILADMTAVFNNIISFNWKLF